MILVQLLSKFGIFTDYYQIIYFFEILKYTLCLHLFNWKVKKRKFYILRSLLGYGLLIAYGYLLGYLRTVFSNSTIYQMMATLSIYFFMFVYLAFLVKEKKLSSLIIYWVTASCCKEIIGYTYDLLSLILGSDPRHSILFSNYNNWLAIGFHDGFRTLLALLCYYGLFRKDENLIQDRKLNVSIGSISIIMLVGMVVIKTFAVANSDGSRMLYTCCVSLLWLISILLLFLRTSILRESKHLIDEKIMNQVLANNQVQYKSLKSNIEIINSKAHDIKHQLEKYQDKLTEEEVKSLKKSISFYDKNIHTGNPVLDTVLYSESLHCDKLGISFTHLCNGQALNQYPASKIYYLLSNILDNAIDASKDVEVKSRVISLTIKEKNGQILIKECNYFTGTRNMEDGLIKTTKKDDINHGYGLKSIKMIVESLKGTLNITILDNMFFLNINLPYQPKEEKQSINSFSNPKEKTAT